MEHFIYLVHSTGKQYKVGYTNNLERRQREYNTHNPNAHIMEYIKVSTEAEGRAIENIFHDEIQSLYNAREWFTCEGRRFKLSDLRTAYGYIINTRVRHRA